MELTIPLRTPHSEKQRQLVAHPGSLVVLAGRRYGKTDAMVQRLFYWLAKKPGMYWWIGLDWRSASLKRAWRKVAHISNVILAAAGLRPVAYINRSRAEVNLPGLGAIWFRTAAHPESLAGEGINGAIVDEFTLMQPRVWSEYLEATLLDYGGWAAFTGVPKGNNWGANLWREAKDREGWLQVHATTYENPHINKAALDEMRAHVSERYFRQEILAEIVDDAGMVFHHVMQAVRPDAWKEAPEPGREYIVGVDWGKVNDYTVVSVLDIAKRAFVYYDKFNVIDYDVQTERLRGIMRKWKPVVVIPEANAMGAPLADFLIKEGWPVLPFTTTRASKQIIIDALALAFGEKSIIIPPDDDMISELQAFEVTKTPSGTVRYSAPPGLHDDIVMSMALAWSGLGTGPVEIEENIFY